MKLNIKAFSIACGLLLGFGILFVTWWIILLEGATHEVTFLGRVYIGYDISITGSLIGFAWGLIDGAIWGAIFSWLYNTLSDKFKSDN